MLGVMDAGTGVDVVEVDGAVSKGHVSDGVLTCWAIDVSNIVDRWVPYEASQQEELMKFHTQTTKVDRTIVIIYLLVFPCFFPRHGYRVSGMLSILLQTNSGNPKSYRIC